MNKKTIAGIAALALAGIAALWMCLSAIARTTYGGYNALRVVIDAGHGGIDGGVSGVTTGTKESDINLEIALFLQEEQECSGSLCQRLFLRLSAAYALFFPLQKKQSCV